MVTRRTLVVAIVGFALLLVAVVLQVVDAVASPIADAVAILPVVQLDPVKDNTLYAEIDLLSNGKGQHLFAGVTQEGYSRRALIKFDIDGQLPPEALIVSATLQMFVSKHPFVYQPNYFSLHRVLSEWGEGTSYAPGEEGMGTLATEGDATWSFSFYSPTPTERISWTVPGGDFIPTASAISEVGQQGQYDSWGPSPGMSADLQQWLGSPVDNHGWILIGDESDVQTARRFDSRENEEITKRPVLYVQYATDQLLLPLIRAD